MVVCDVCVCVCVCVCVRERERERDRERPTPPLVLLDSGQTPVWGSDTT